MTIYIGNAFSLNMLDRTGKPRSPRPWSLDMVQTFLSRVPTAPVSCIGHEDTARIVSSLLGRSVPVNRITVRLADEDTLLVAQYVGPRLPEGTTVLPEGARVEWWAI